MTPTPAEQHNIRTVVELEHETFDRRSRRERVTDAVSATASSPVFVVAHVAWFAIWIGFNMIAKAPFDRFPYNLLTLAVSLEAIVLTGFVLMAQNRMTLQADKRAHLDLQVNLLAEQKLTAILRMLALLGEHAGIDLGSCDPGFEQFRSRTNIRQLAAELDAQLGSVAPTSAGDPPPSQS